MVASFTNSGKLVEQVKFKTPKDYQEFLKELEKTISNLNHNIFTVACVAIPALLDSTKSIGIAFGNRPWRNVPIKKDLKTFIDCPITIENDANLAGLSEAINIIKDYKITLYLTISTGIGAGIITNGTIDPDFADSEVGQMKVQFNDRMRRWEEIASGSAIVKYYGKQASEINDKKTWKEICHRLALGMNSLIAVIQPDVIIIGGSVGSHLKKYGKILKDELKKYSTPLTPVPPIKQAYRAEEAVIYGCYYLAKRYYESTTK